eukprot:1152120-Pelagomonas_calceolata.AAC.3
MAQILYFTNHWVFSLQFFCNDDSYTETPHHFKSPNSVQLMVRNGGAFADPLGLSSAPTPCCSQTSSAAGLLCVSPSLSPAAVLFGRPHRPVLASVFFWSAPMKDTLPLRSQNRTRVFRLRYPPVGTYTTAEALLWAFQNASDSRHIPDMLGPFADPYTDRPELEKLKN